MIITLTEQLTYDQANLVTEAVTNSEGNKDLFLKGIFIQGDVRNQNQRVYPVNEITNAVKSIQEKIKDGYSVLGEADHPDDLQVNLDRVSHMIEKMWMDGQDGYGRLKLLPTPMGNICKTLLDNGVKLGVSSRGSGNVTDSGNVSDFEIQTVDIVANPSAPDAYPDPLYEQIMNGKRGNVLMDVASAVNNDKLAEQYFQKEVQKFIEKLDIRRK
jgi:hypothetical protein